MGILVVVLAIALFELAAFRWGADSRDGVDSPEWESRWLWQRSHN